MKVVLLTGASGFIGCRVRELLVERGYRVHILTRNPTDKQHSIDRFIVSDLVDLSGCRQAVTGVDMVIHVAGEKRDPARFWPVNVGGTKNLLVVACDEGVKKFVYVSSVGVVGADPLKTKTVDEESPCRPGNDYERSKWEAEKLAIDAGSDELAVTVLRPANVFGDRHPEQGLLRLIQAIRRGRFAYLGGRDVMCNYVFVEDVAHAILALAEHPNAVGRIFHLSDSCTLGEFIDAMATELGVEKPTPQLPNPLAHLVRVALRGARRLPMVSNSSAFARMVSLNNQASFATHRLVDELGFELPVGWRIGLKRVVEWYRSEGMI